MKTPQQQMYERVAAEMQARLDAGIPRSWADAGRSATRGAPIGRVGRPPTACKARRTRR